MKTLFSFFAAATFLIPVASAFAGDNGVERGDISISTNDSVPSGVEDRIETTIFANCDLRGASRISTGYVQYDRNDAQASTEYDIQYAVEFPKDGRTVMINVQAVLHLQGSPETAIEIAVFSSPICRNLP